MAKLFNLARVTTATTGTGTITLGSAVSGALSFAAAGVADGDVVRYGIKDGSASEVGTGTYTASGTTLTRTVLKSTNSDSAINLSGSAEVFICDVAEDHLPHDALSIPGAYGLVKNFSDVPIWVRTGSVSMLQDWYPTQSATGAGASASTAPIMTLDGIGYGLSSGTTTTGAATYAFGSLNTAYAPVRPFEPGTLYCGIIRLIDAISDGTDTYRINFGATDEATFANFGANGIWFRYASADYSDSNIRAITRAASTSTVTDTGVAMVADTPLRFAIEIESASSVKFYINDAVVATHTTNIPTGAAACAFHMGIKKSAGTNARRVQFSQAKILRFF